MRGSRRISAQHPAPSPLVPNVAPNHGRHSPAKKTQTVSAVSVKRAAKVELLSHGSPYHFQGPPMYRQSLAAWSTGKSHYIKDFITAALRLESMKLA
mmetsp:Transcript_122579/g.236327  ORF Transcript_122579/g.236327 Transcript_122579/m.236327 type:complete len:97 (+) Transcript_122579:708-998(+)